MRLLRRLGVLFYGAELFRERLPSDHRADASRPTLCTGLECRAGDRHATKKAAGCRHAGRGARMLLDPFLRAKITFEAVLDVIETTAIWNRDIEGLTIRGRNLMVLGHG